VRLLLIGIALLFATAFAWHEFVRLQQRLIRLDPPDATSSSWSCFSGNLNKLKRIDKLTEQRNGMKQFVAFATAIGACRCGCGAPALELHCLRASCVHAAAHRVRAFALRALCSVHLHCRRAAASLGLRVHASWAAGALQRIHAVSRALNASQAALSRDAPPGLLMLLRQCR
jgi:hypothetical protein